MNSITFKTFVNGKETELTAKMPSLTDQREGQKVYNQAFSDAVKSGSIVRAKLDDLLVEQGLWDDTKQARFTGIQKEIAEGEKSLAKGGISLKQAKNVAITMRELRDELRELISVRTNLDTHTAEGQADNARFNYLVSSCVVYTDSKKTYFSGYEDYLNKSSDLVAINGAQKLAAMLYGLDSDFEKKLPENKFLVQYKFLNDKLQFIDNAGRLTDSDGRLVDANGRYVNDTGGFVDREGSLVDLQGDYIVDFVPFTDENGQPVVLDTSNDVKQEDPAVKPSDVQPPVVPPQPPEVTPQPPVVQSQPPVVQPPEASSPEPTPEV